MNKLILGKQYTLTELSRIEGAYTRGNIYVCDSAEYHFYDKGKQHLANGTGVRCNDGGCCITGDKPIFTLKYLVETSTPQVVKPYTLESSQKGMLPPIGSTVILCVWEDACVTRRLHNLDGKEVTITDVDKYHAYYTVEDDKGTYTSYANSSWFKPVAKSDSDNTIEDLKAITGSTLTKTPMASYILSRIKNGAIRNLNYTGE